MEDIVFPKYEFDFEVVSLHYEIGQFNVLYKPKDKKLTNIEYSLPILPNMDLDNLMLYVEQWAPYSKWYAQEMILDNSEKLLGAKS